jgi:hypothetical protein
MWITHYAPSAANARLSSAKARLNTLTGLIAKIIAPRVPIAMLTFAGEANDALFVLPQILNVEHFVLNAQLAKSCGCFPYDGEYPYSHSLFGIATVGIVLAFWHACTARGPVQPVDLPAIFGCTLTHFVLEWPTHRADVHIVPGDDAHIGKGLFNAPANLFILDIVWFFAGISIYLALATPRAKGGYLRSKHLGKVVPALFLA